MFYFSREFFCGFAVQVIFRFVLYRVCAATVVKCFFICIRRCCLVEGGLIVDSRLLTFFAMCLMMIDRWSLSLWMQRGILFDLSMMCGRQHNFKISLVFFIGYSRYF